MSEEEAEKIEQEQFTLLLAACDEKLAAGLPLTEVFQTEAPPELRARLEDEAGWCQLVRTWLSPSSSTSSSAPSRPSTPLGQEGSAATALTRLGRFEIKRELGRGAFGIVFLAYDPTLRREVALKIPRAEALLTPELRSRFQHEARAAAGLNHPNLVPVYDAGQEGSICYIASAYSPGITLADWLKRRKEPVSYRTAAELVAALAGGVEHAHQHGVLHRDLKPSNIMLEASPASAPGDLELGSETPGLVPKVTDFGLAKLLDGAGGKTAAGHQTQTGAILGSPTYMAPEQAGGQSRVVGPAADIYALGTILYELLTARPPFQADSVLETLALVCNQEPLSPSRLRPRLPRDLETICLKCLEKPPAKRYATAQELAEDLERFLASEPIRARPTPGWERAWKWAKRHPLAAALAGVSSAAAVALLAVILFSNARLQRQRDIADVRRKEAEANFQEAQVQRRRAVTLLRKAREAVDQMLTRVGQERLAPVPYMVTVRRELLEDALRFYQEFAQQVDNDPEVRLESGRAARRLGKVFQMLGERKKAEQSFRQALAVDAKLSADYPSNTSYSDELGSCYATLALVLVELDRPKEAEEPLSQALKIQERLVADVPAEGNSRHNLAGTQQLHGRLLEQEGKLQDAEKAFRRGVDVLEKLVRDFPFEQDYQLSLANSHSNLGVFLARQGRILEAEPEFRRDLDLWSKLAEASPSVPRYRSRVGLSAGNLGRLLVENGRQEEGEPFIRQAVEQWQKLVDDFPNVPDYHIALG
ncbi:MAG TPA: serine/threonine-protein kinase, partial [Isosphaeraceae bacterium]|nr:serine/threonine-protein kinase [Isosphaeraceae bacterium]